jgi:hypothetical protein
VLSGFTEKDFIHNPDGTWEPRDREKYNASRARIMAHTGIRTVEEYQRLVRTEGKAFLSRLYTAP